ncbi:uncharacterized protein FMAN_02178 [Fusarium mangiferae]|uniref:Uncharacterized protein n=1 Tax=Fusarium mangiferae TaxID=192010 RepID=A0A1L7TWZ1_FUSMA|nr:uncharacterized protein FMAN_02178 [Fusarium mangiferae]CVK99336.1 uncharacterized protein FMAN_02178 [Fusarium mangiferae]
MHAKRSTPWRLTLSSISLLIFSLFLLRFSFVPAFRLSSSDPGAVALDDDFHYSPTLSHVSKREDDPPTDPYEIALKKGEALYCDMKATQAALEAKNGKSAESPSYLQKHGLEDYEGWDKLANPKPTFGDRLNEALKGIGAPISLYHYNWVNTGGGDWYSDPAGFLDGSLDLDEAEVKAVAATGANFASSFSLNPGVIIADHNVGVNYAAKQASPIDKETTALTHIQQWSDAVWMQWDRVCSESGDVQDLKYIIRAQVVNHATLKIVFQAILNKYDRDHKKKSLGPWKKRIVMTHQKDPKELYAILGSPNGSGAAFMLINHKNRLGGARAINKVEIFVPEGNFEVKGTEVGREQEEWHVMLLFHIVDASRA